MLQLLAIRDTMEIEEDYPASSSLLDSSSTIPCIRLSPFGLFSNSSAESSSSRPSTLLAGLSSSTASSPLSQSQENSDGHSKEVVRPFAVDMDGIVEQDDTLLLEGFSQDLADLEAADLVAAEDRFIFSQSMSGASSRSILPELAMHEINDSSSSSGSDMDADHEVVDDIYFSQSAAVGFSQDVQSDVQTFPDISNAELQTALEALHLDQPVTFHPEATSSQRR